MSMLLLTIAAFFMPSVMGECQFPDQFSGIGKSGNKVYNISIDLSEKIALFWNVKNNQIWAYYDFKTMRRTTNDPATGCKVSVLAANLTLPASDPSKLTKMCDKNTPFYNSPAHGKLKVSIYDNTKCVHLCLPQEGALIADGYYGMDWTYNYMANYVRGEKKAKLYEHQLFTCKK